MCGVLGFEEAASQQQHRKDNNAKAERAKRSIVRAERRESERDRDD